MEETTLTRPPAYGIVYNWDGSHEVKVVLVERNPRLTRDIVLTNVELVITYKGGQKEPNQVGLADSL